MACQNFSGLPDVLHANSGTSVFSGSNSVVKGFSATLGVGGTESSIDIDVVFDLCSGGGSADIAPGYAVIAVYGGFSFGGIVDKIEESRSESGVGYKIRVSDPRKLLSSVGLLLDGYLCSTFNSETNFINVDNILQGNSAGSAGCSGTSVPSIGDCNAYQYGKLIGGGTFILQALQAIQGSTNPIYAPSGVACGFNFTPLINMVSQRAQYATYDGNSSNLLDFLNAAADAASVDIQVNMYGGSQPLIEVATIDRFSPVGGTGSFNNKVAAAEAAGVLINSSSGSELTYNTSKKVILGDSVHYMTTTNNILMYLGDDPINFSPIVTTPDNLNSGSIINGSSLVGALQAFGISIPGPRGYITTGEILAATSGYQAWMYYSKQNPGSIGGVIGPLLFGQPWFTSIGNMERSYQSYIGDRDARAKGALLDAAHGVNEAFTMKQANTIFRDVVHSWVMSWISKYYGTQYLCELSSPICAKGYIKPMGNGVVDGSGQGVQLSDEVTDAGWADPGLNVLGLSQGTAMSALFENNDGRLRCFAAVQAGKNQRVSINGIAYPYYLDFTKLGDYVGYGNTIYLPMQTSGRMYALNGTNSAPWVHVTGPKLSCLMPPTAFGSGVDAFSKYSGITPDQVPEGNKTEFNMYRNAEAATAIDTIAIPMKSNQYVYGPYSGSRGNYGKTEIVKQSELNPWTYGNSSEMQRIGETLAYEGLSSQLFTNTGTMNVAIAPEYSLGSIGNDLTLGSVVVQMGAQGCQSTYNFSSFTRKFGEYGRAMADSMKRGVSIRRDMSNTIKDIRLKNLSQLTNALKTMGELARQAALLNASSGSPPGDSSSSEAASLSPLILGGYSEQPNVLNYGCSYGCGASGADDGQTPISQNILTCEEICELEPPDFQSGGAGNGNQDDLTPEVGVYKYREAVHQADAQNFNAYAINSWDLLLSPVSLRGSGNLPPMADYPFTKTNSYRNKPRPIMPPLKSYNGNDGNGYLSIGGFFLNPLLSKAMIGIWDVRKGGTSSGTSVMFIGHGTDPSKCEMTSQNSEAQDSSDFRFNALKGPLMLHGWGYDTEGKPIPNYADDATSCAAGTFKSTGLWDQFLTNWNSNPKTWPMGPIDLRWDRDRGCWVSPPEERIIVAQLEEDLPAGGTSEAIVINPGSGEGSFYLDHDVYGPQGEHITGEISGARITVSDFLGRNLCKGVVVYVYHYGEAKYIVLESSAVSQSSGECDCECTPSTSTTVATTYTDPTYTDPTATDPTYTDPTYTDPTYTDPTYTDPTATYYDPTYTDPTYTDPTATYYDPTYTVPYGGDIYCYNAEDEVYEYDGDPDDGGEFTGTTYGPGKFCRAGGEGFWATWILDEGRGDQGRGFYTDTASGPYLTEEKCQCDCIDGDCPTTTTEPPAPPGAGSYCYDGFGNSATDFEIEVSTNSDMSGATTVNPTQNKFCFVPANESNTVFAWLGPGGSIEELTPNSGPFESETKCYCSCVGFLPDGSDCPTPDPTTTYPPTDATPTPECDACGFYDCFTTLNNGSPPPDGVIGIADGCVTIYPLKECPGKD